MNKQEFINTIKNMEPPKYFSALTFKEAFKEGFETAKNEALFNATFLDKLDEQQKQNDKDLSYLKNYVTLECVYSRVFWFEAGKHYIIKNVTPTTVEIMSNYDDTVTFNLENLNGKYIAFKPGSHKII